MDHDDDGETSFVDDVAFEPTYPQALLTAAGRNVATIRLRRKIDMFIFSKQARAIHRSRIVVVSRL